jgi:hypothetical protein
VKLHKEGLDGDL